MNYIYQKIDQYKFNKLLNAKPFVYNSELNDLIHHKKLDMDNICLMEIFGLS